MTLRREPIRSTAIRRAAKGKPCTLEIPGICQHDSETTVFAHVKDESFGRGVKADDISGFFADHWCHAAYDQHRTGLEEADELRLVLRAMQRTLRLLVIEGIVVVPLDEHKPLSQRPTKPRKPAAERKAIQPRINAWPPKGSRKIQSREMRAR